MVLNIIGIVVVFPLFCFVLYLMSAKLGWHAIELKKNEGAILMAGSTIVGYRVGDPTKFVDNTGKVRPIRPPVAVDTGGKDADGNAIMREESKEDDLIDPDYWAFEPGPIRKWLQEEWGVFPGSWRWPWVGWHTFLVPPDKLVSRKDVADDAPLSSRIEHGKERRVNKILLEFPRPFLLTNIPMGRDRIPVHFLLAGNFVTTNLCQAAVVLGSRLFSLLESETGGHLQDFVHNKEFTDDVAGDKKDATTKKDGVRNKDDGISDMKKGPGSPFSEYMKSHNETFDRIVGLKVKDGLWIEEIRAANPENQKAVEAKKLAVLKGEAQVATSEKNLEAARNDAEAKAAPVAALIEAWGGDEKAKGRASRQVVFGSLSGLKVLNFGGDSGVSTLLDLDSKDSPPEPPITDPPTTPSKPKPSKS